MVEEGTVSRPDAELMQVADTVEQALDIIRAPGEPASAAPRPDPLD